jgi:hypothetical protein
MPSPKPGRPRRPDGPNHPDDDRAEPTGAKTNAASAKAQGTKAKPAAAKKPAAKSTKPTGAARAKTTTGTKASARAKTPAAKAKAAPVAKAKAAARPTAAAPTAKAASSTKAGTATTTRTRPAEPPPPRTGDGEGDVVLDLTGDEPVIDLRETPSPARPVSGRPLDLDHGLTLRNLSTEDGETYARAERFVYEIYRAAGYCRESSRHRVEELQPWRDDCELWTVLDEEGTVLGTTRIIFGPWADLPVGQFRRIDDRDADPVAELSSLAIAPTARGLSVVVHLCRAAFVHSWRRGASALVCIIDGWMVDLLCDVYALPMRPVGAKRFHMGGDVTPSSMSFVGSEFEETARRNTGYWQWMTEAFTPEEIGRWDIPIVLDDPEAHPWMNEKRAKLSR